MNTPSTEEKFLKKISKTEKVLKAIGSNLYAIFLILGILLSFFIGAIFIGTSWNNYFGNFPTESRLVELISEDERLADYEYSPNDIFWSAQRCYQVTLGNECVQDFQILTDEIILRGEYIWGTRRVHPTYTLQIERLE